MVACVVLATGAWNGLELVEHIAEGNRNEVWRGRLGDSDVSVRQSRRDPASLRWELDLLGFVADAGLLVPAVVPTDAGASHADGVVVQRWLHGRPPSSDDDWQAVADELRRLHRVTSGTVDQRPGCCVVTELRTNIRSVDADLDALPPAEREFVISILAEFADIPTAVVHGDPMTSNIRLDDAGRVGLLDWDESRVDLVWHDLSNLGIQVLPAADHERAQRLSNAWEAVNGWLVEPAYARRRLSLLT